MIYLVKGIGGWFFIYGAIVFLIAQLIVYYRIQNYKQSKKKKK